MAYDRKSKYAVSMTVEEFKDYAFRGVLIDIDGIGCPVKDGLEDDGVTIFPSMYNKIPQDATHINWYNR